MQILRHQSLPAMLLNHAGAGLPGQADLRLNTETTFPNKNNMVGTPWGNVGVILGDNGQENGNYNNWSNIGKQSTLGLCGAVESKVVRCNWHTCQ